MLWARPPRRPQDAGVCVMQADGQSMPDEAVHSTNVAK
jgi:hypothetical protein